MNEDVKVSLIAGGVSSSLCFITTLIINGDVRNPMEIFLKSILPALITGILGMIAAIITVRRSQLKKNTTAIENLSKRLGDFKNRTLENMLGNTDKLSLCDQFSEVIIATGVEKGKSSLSEQHKEILDATGVNKDRPSLSKQHENLAKLLEKEINVVEKRYEEENRKMRSFSLKEEDMYKKIEDLRTLMQSWISLTDDVEKMQTKIYELEDELETAQSEVSRLQEEAAELKLDNEKLKSQVATQNQITISPDRHSYDRGR